MHDKQKDFYDTMPGKKTPFLLYKESFFTKSYSAFTAPKHLKHRHVGAR